jgi:hypothetical protein
VTGGLTALVDPIVRSETYGWSSAQVLVPLRIFRSRAIAGSNVYMVLLYAAMFGSFYFETLYLQRILGYAP